MINALLIFEGERETLKTMEGRNRQLLTEAKRVLSRPVLTAQKYKKKSTLRIFFCRTAENVYFCRKF